MAEPNEDTRLADETCTYAYVFTCFTDGREKPVDTMLCLNTFGIPEAPIKANVLAEWAALQEGENKKKVDKIFNPLEGMMVRQRYSNGAGGLYLVRTECEIDFEALDAVIQNKYQEGTLQAWLKEAKI